MTDDVDVGSIVFSRATKGYEGYAARSGMVVDCGIAEDGSEYLVVLDEHVLEPIKAWKVRNRVVARRIMLADLDEALSQAPDKIRMVGGARGAMLTVGCGKGSFSMEQRELAYYGALLLEGATL